MGLNFGIVAGQPSIGRYSEFEIPKMFVFAALLRVDRSLDRDRGWKTGGPLANLCPAVRDPV